MIGDSEEHSCGFLKIAVDTWKISFPGASEEPKIWILEGSPDFSNVFDRYLRPEQMRFYTFFTFVPEILRRSNASPRWDLWGTFKSTILCQSSV